MSMFNCEYCKKQFVTNFTLTRHVRQFHKDAALPEVRRRGRKPKQTSNDTFVTCDICDNKQVNKKALTYHRKRKHEQTDSEERRKSEATALQFENFTGAEPTLFKSPVRIQPKRHPIQHVLECTSHDSEHCGTTEWLGTTSAQRSPLLRSKITKTEHTSRFLNSTDVKKQDDVLERRTRKWKAGKDLACPSFKNVIVPTKQEKDKKCIELKYNCATDMYIRGEEKIDEWMSLVSEAENIIRKVEYDWDKVYLARVDNVDRSKITWKVDLDSSRMSVTSVDIEVHSTCYETGEVVWELYGDQQMVTLTSGKRETVTELRDSKVLLLTATLTKGTGRIAWQHTQLFRQKRFPVSGVDLEWPFSVVIHLKG